MALFYSHCLVGIVLYVTKHRPSIPVCCTSFYRSMSSLFTSHVCNQCCLSISSSSSFLYCASPQGVGVSDMLIKCKSIRAFELYLHQGSESLNALTSCLEGVRYSASIENLSVACLDAGQ